MGPEEVVESLAGAEVVLILTSGDFHGTLEKLVEDTGKKFS
jgi:hypothetical protein